MSIEPVVSTALGRFGSTVIEVKGRQLRLELEPEVASPNYYTYPLIDAIVDSSSQPRFVLDVGTGTGVLSLVSAIRWPTASIDGLDPAAAAVALTRRNMLLNRVPSTRFRAFCATAEDFAPDRAYDLIIANPPQIPVPPEDETVSGAGPNGTDAALDVVRLADRALAREGELLMLLADFVPLAPIEAAVARMGLELVITSRAGGIAGPFTSSYRSWIERNGYRFGESEQGLRFELQLLTASHPA